MKTFPCKALVLSILALSLSACSTIEPRAFSEQELARQGVADKAAAQADVEPVAGALTLEQALARALKFNLDRRAKMMEEALALGQLDVARYDMLPKLMAQAGYTSRNNDKISESRNADNGTLSQSHFISQDRNHGTGMLGLSWNVLDFGVSYYQARQQADRTLILRERRRKVVHSLLQQVRQAYWLALGAQQMEAKVGPLLREVEQALEDTGKIERENLRGPLEPLNYQRQLLDTLRQLEAIRDELAQAKPRLAALMNLDPGQPFALADTHKMAAPELGGSVAQMERVAMLNRPELVEARYNERISLLDTKKAIARLMPGLELSVGEHYDSNSYLVDNKWAAAGLRVSWNIFNLLSAREIIETADAQLEVTRMQRMALNMAVLSQVYIAYRDFQGRKRQYELAATLERVDRKILEHTRNAAHSDAQGRLAEIRAGVGALFSELRLQQSHGALQHAYGAMLATLGVDLLPPEVPGHDLPALSLAMERAIATHWNAPALTPGAAGEAP